jgi:hypothetical protein
MLMSEQWWVLGGDRRPVGPVTTDLLLKGITSGTVPTDTLVCVVGGTEWQELGDVSWFASAVTEMRGREDAVPPVARRARRGLLEIEERTIVDGIPLWPADPTSEEPTASMLRQRLATFDDTDEHTIVDAPLRPSEPPE